MILNVSNDKIWSIKIMSSSKVNEAVPNVKPKGQAYGHLRFDIITNFARL